MGVYLRAKFEASSIILTSLRQGVILPPPLPTTTSKRTPKKPTQDVPCDMYCNATPVLKSDSVCKQSKNYHPQVYAEECKYTNTKSQQYSMLGDDGNGYFEV